MRKLQIGLINIMPQASQYEALLLAGLRGQADYFDLHPIRLRSHSYHSSPGGPAGYRCYDEVQASVPLDLLIVTGAPVEHLPFEQIRYWPEIELILAHAQAQLRGVLGICFGGLAVGKFLGLEKVLRAEKAFGVRDLTLSAAGRQWLGVPGHDTCMPLSTWALFEPRALDAALGSHLQVLASDAQLGPVVVQSRDESFLMVLGHPEYSAETLRQEWRRDLERAIPYSAHYTESAFPAMAADIAQRSHPWLAHWIRKHHQASQLAA